MSYGKRIVVAGINTDVGKTIIAAILTEALGGYYWKPVQCGMPRDRSWVNERLSLENRCHPESFCLDTPCSPHLAARIEGVRIEARDLIPPICSGHLIIEGTGGFLSPLNETENWADAAALWDAHWILVHRHYLGSLNHFFLTVEAMKHRKLSFLGVVFNGDGDSETEEMLLKKANTRCLARISHKILDEDRQDVAPDSLTMDREHCPRDKARPVGGKDGGTDCSDSPRVYEKCGLARISHKILDEDGQDVTSDLPTMSREHCPRDKARPIGGEDGVTNCSDSPRVCEKCGLGRLLWQQQLTPTIIQKIAKEWKAAIHAAL